MNNLMKYACKVCNTHEAEIFRVACLYNHKNFNTKEMMVEYKIQTGSGQWECWVMDTVLDILAGRIPVKVFDTEAGWVWIIRPFDQLPIAERWKHGNRDADWQERD